MPRIRAAFDLGSSHHKLVVATVPAHPTHAPKVLYTTSIRVPLADALPPSNRLPHQILSASLSAVLQLKAAATAHGATAFAAVATQVFRTASNGLPHLARLAAHGVRVALLSPADEGALAFATALAAAPASRPASPVVWDSGGASTQWTLRDPLAGLFVHAVAVGARDARAALRRFGAGDSVVGRLAEWVRGVAGSPGGVLAERVARGAPVLGIGGGRSMFGLAAERVGCGEGGVFTEAEVWAVVHGVARGGAAQGEEFSSVMPKLVLLAGLMGVYRIRAVRYVPTNGSCVGLVVSEDARFWGVEGGLERREERFQAIRHEDRLFAESVQKTSATTSC